MRYPQQSTRSYFTKEIYVATFSLSEHTVLLEHTGWPDSIIRAQIIERSRLKDFNVRIKLFAAV